MKIITLLVLATLSFSSFAQLELGGAREYLFECRNFGPREEVNELFIVESTLGRRTYYEVEVPYISNGEEKVFSRKLNLISKYDGKVLLFTTGNYRVKVDRAMPDHMRYKTFVRLPNFDIHSTHWFCKDY